MLKNEDKTYIGNCPTGDYKEICTAYKLKQSRVRAIKRFKNLKLSQNNNVKAMQKI